MGNAIMELSFLLIFILSCFQVSVNFVSAVISNVFVGQF